MNCDNRLIGRTAENTFLAILNQKGIFATSFDTEGFDGIIFDHDHKYFKGGKSPYYTQIKCRGSKNKDYSTQGHNEATIQKIKKIAIDLRIDEKSAYFTVGFFRHNDIRTLQFYSIPLSHLIQFKGKNSQYRFSVERCEQAIATQRKPDIVKI